MWLSKPFLIALLGATSLLLTACGFHLRGGVEISGLDSLGLIANDMRSGIVPGLKRSLRASGINVVEDVQDETIGLRILEDGFSQRVLSVGQNNRTLEYEMLYTVRFVLEDAMGRNIQPASSIVLSRDFLNDEENVLGTSTQTASVREEMKRDMVQAVLRKLRILLANTVSEERGAPSK